jgi:small subunit ribosomal protein S2
MSVDIKELFESGAHFGHKTSRWHPKMAPYIHSTKGDQHIINLEKTVEQLEQAIAALEDVASRGKQVLFVGTKKQAAGAVERAAKASDMPYVNLRWMGGMLTNHKTINDRVKHLRKLEEKMLSGELASRYNKLEVQRFQEEIDKLNDNFGGIKNLQAAPGAVVVVDVKNEHIAVNEANKLGVPVIAIVDTNSDPSNVRYPIPANDDSLKAVEMILGHLANAVNDGKKKKKAAPAAKPAVKVEGEKPAAKKEEAKKEKTKKPAKKDEANKPAKKETKEGK